MTHASLFSGIGGFDLAARNVGWTNVFHVEKHPWCRQVLDYHFPESKSYDDIKQFDATPFRGRVRVLSGGFPCQPFSSAGARAGTSDDRYLWPEMLRVISEVMPTWVVGENVRGLVSWNDGLVLDTVCADLERLGYEVFPTILPAAGVSAPHRRDRIFFLARKGGLAVDTDYQGGREELGHFPIPDGEVCERNYDTEPGYASPADAPDAVCNGTGDAVRGNGSGTTQVRGRLTQSKPGTQGGDGDAPNTDDTGLTHRTKQCRGSEAQSGKGERSPDGRGAKLASDTGGLGRERGRSQAAEGRESERLGLQPDAEGQSEGRDATYANADGSQGSVPADQLQQLRGQEVPASERVSHGQGPRVRFAGFPTQSPVCGGDDGLPTELDGMSFSKWRRESIAAYGNAVCVPLIETIFESINEQENAILRQDGQPN